MSNDACAVTPAVSPEIDLVTRTVPNTAMVGLVTVNVALPPAGTVAVIPGAQVGVPHTNAGDSSAGSGDCSWTVHGLRAGTVTLVVPPAATVTCPRATPQSYVTTN